MAIVVMDTATEVLSVGVGVEKPVADGPSDGSTIDGAKSDVEVLYASTAIVPRAHSRWLQPSIGQALQVCGVDMEKVDSIGVGVGPGSYTGVRLAVSTAKAMASVLGVPMVPLPTLLTLAEAAAHGQPGPIMVLSMLNARRNRGFGAIYEKDANSWRTVEPIRVTDVGEWVDGFASRVHRDRQAIHVVHDFPESIGLDDDVVRAIPGATVHHLSDVRSFMPEAMLRLAVHRPTEISIVTGEDIHAVVPEYALLVEAESRLAEGSDRIGG